MKTQKISTKKITKKVSNVVDNAKKTMSKANDYALNKTEEVVTETISIASKWQKVTDKALKGGVDLLEKQQNFVFDTLEMYKENILKGKKKLNKIFS